MAVRIINLPVLFKADGKPYLLRRRDCPMACRNFQEDRFCFEHTTEEAASLVRWVALMIEQLPLGNLTALDGKRMLAVLEACKRDQELLELDQAEYDWLKKILFDDAEAKRVHRDLGGNYALNRYGLVATAVQQGLEQLQPHVDNDQKPGS